MAQWAKIDLTAQMMTNVGEAMLTRSHAAVENAYQNDAGGFSRFPGLRMLVEIPGQMVYTTVYRGELFAVSSAGRFYRIGLDGSTEDMTGVPISGGARPVFAVTDEALLIAAGGPLVKWQGVKTELMGGNAPSSTHVGYLDGYAVAIEPGSGRFRFSLSPFETWNDMDVFSAEGKPDDLIALVVTPYRELLLCGTESVERFMTLASGDKPFYRQYVTGQGLGAPYAIAPTDDGVFAINDKREFVRLTGSANQVVGRAIGLTLERADSLEGAWASELLIEGNRFVVLQLPNASNAYGTNGITLLYDLNKNRFSFLYGWDAGTATPTRWPAWSITKHGGRVFCGVPGGVAELTAQEYLNLGQDNRFLVRTAHIGDFGMSTVGGLSLRLQRGVGPGQMRVRVNRDNRGFGPWVPVSLGQPGHREMTVRLAGFGAAETWQWEFSGSDPAVLNLSNAEMLVERLRR